MDGGRQERFDQHSRIARHSPAFGWTFRRSGEGSRGTKAVTMGRQYGRGRGHQKDGQPISRNDGRTTEAKSSFALPRGAKRGEMATVRSEQIHGSAVADKESFRCRADGGPPTGNGASVRVGESGVLASHGEPSSRVAEAGNQIFGGGLGGRRRETMESSATPNTSRFTEDQPRGRRRHSVGVEVERTTMVESDRAVWGSSDDCIAICSERRTRPCGREGNPKWRTAVIRFGGRDGKKKGGSTGGEKIRDAILRKVGNSPCGEAVEDLIARKMWADRTMDKRFSQWVKWPLFCAEDGRNALRACEGDLLA